MRFDAMRFVWPFVPRCLLPRVLDNNRNLHILDAVAQLEFMRRVLTCKTSTTTTTSTPAGEITTTTKTSERQLFIVFRAIARRRGSLTHPTEQESKRNTPKIAKYSKPVKQKQQQQQQ